MIKKCLLYSSQSYNYVAPGPAELAMSQSEKLCNIKGHEIKNIIILSLALRVLFFGLIYQETGENMSSTERKYGVILT